MKKLSIIFCFLTILLSTGAFAIPKGPCDKNEACCDEAPAGPFAFSYPKDLGLPCPRGFQVYGEFLLMKGSEEGLEYAIVNNSAAGPWVFPLQDGIVHGFSSRSQEWDWRPGFRVGFGASTINDDWLVDFSWTYIRIKANAFTDYAGSGDYLPLFLPPINPLGTFMLHDASARWTGDYNTFDITLGKPYHVSRYFTSTPIFGFRAAWIDQDMTYRYSLITQDLFGVKAYFKNDYWGMGLLARHNCEFTLSPNWKIYSKTLVSLLWGKFDLTQHASWRTIETGPSIPQSYDVEDSFYNVQPNAELGLGICWNKFLNKHQYLLSVKVGYEFIHFWDQNQIRKFFDLDPVANDTTSRGDLSFNGLQFALNLDF